MRKENRKEDRKEDRNNDRKEEWNKIRISIRIWITEEAEHLCPGKMEELRTGRHLMTLK